MSLYRTLDLKFNPMNSSHFENNFKRAINCPTTRANMNEPTAAFHNLFLPQHPFWPRLSSPAPPTIGQHLVTIRLSKDKLSKRIPFIFHCHICDLPQHALKLISAPQVKKPWPTA